MSLPRYPKYRESGVGLPTEVPEHWHVWPLRYVASCNDDALDEDTAPDFVGDDLMVIAEEYGEWEDSNRRIDFLCLSKDAGLVVVEIKRTDDGGCCASPANPGADALGPR